MDIDKVDNSVILYPVGIAAQEVGLAQPRVHYMMRTGKVKAYFRMKKNGELQKTPLVDLLEIKNILK